MSTPKRWIWMVGVWLVATVAAAAVALAVVGVAGDQVADEAVRPLSAEEVEALGVPGPAPSTTSDPAVAPTTTDPGPGGEIPVTTSTAGPPASSVTTAPPTTQPPATTTTAAAPPTTAPAPTTTSPPEEAQIDSRQITGGTVVVRWTSSSVELVSASPADGYSVEVEKRGPEKVEVKFEGGDVVSEYRAEVSNGQLVVETHVDTEDD